MINMFIAMYSDEPILSIAVLILFLFTLLLPFIFHPFAKRWNAKQAKEMEDRAMEIWDSDTTEDKRYAWAYADSLEKSLIKRHARMSMYNYHRHCGRRKSR